MSHTMRVSRLYMMGQGLLMLCLGTALFILGSIMANPAFDESGYMIAVILVASCLLINGVYHGFLVSRARPRLPIGKYLMACALSISSWLIFWLIQSAPSEIRLLTILAGMQGLFWSLWYMRLAFRLQANFRKAFLLSILAATTSFLGIILATQAHLSEISSVTEVACFTAFIGVQVLLTAIYLFRECAAKGPVQAASIIDRRATETTYDSVILITNLAAAGSDEVHAQAR